MSCRGKRLRGTSAVITALSEAETQPSDPKGGHERGFAVKVWVSLGVELRSLGIKAEMDQKKTLSPLIRAELLKEET